MPNKKNLFAGFGTIFAARRACPKSLSDNYLRLAFISLTAATIIGIPVNICHPYLRVSNPSNHTTEHKSNSQYMSVQRTHFHFLFIGNTRLATKQTQIKPTTSPTQKLVQSIYRSAILSPFV